MKAYPLAKRLAVLDACDSGKGTRQVAKEHQVSESWVRGLKQKRREPWRFLLSPPRRRIPRWKAYEDHIDRIMKADPETTLRVLKAALGTDLSLQTLCRALKELNWSKNRPRGWRDEENLDLPDVPKQNYRLSSPASAFERGYLALPMPSAYEIELAINSAGRET